MKYSKPILQLTSMIFALALALAACQSDTKPEEKAEPAAVAPTATGDTLFIEYGIDLRRPCYVILTNKPDTSFEDLAASIAYLKQLPDSIRTQRFYLIVDSSTAKSRIEELSHALPESGITNYELLDLYKFSQTITEPVSMELNMPKD
jgi:hypothetical protein